MKKILLLLVGVFAVIAASANGPIRFLNISGWSKVCAYVWNSSDSNDKPLGDWPGTAMIKNNTTGFYELNTTLDLSVGYKVIFNNGSSGNGNQVGDFDLTNAAYYYYGAINLYLRGNGDWDTCNDNNKFTPQSDGTYTLTTSITNGNEFKISNSSWNGNLTFGGQSNNPTNFEGTKLSLLRSGDSKNLKANCDLSNVTLVLDLSDCSLEAKSQATEEPDPDPVVDDTNLTVYYDNSTSNWSEVYCYEWNSSNTSEKNNSWPGVKMTLVSGSIYSYTASKTFDKVIFSNGSNNGTEGTDKTKDLDLVNGEVYKLDGSHSTYTTEETPEENTYTVYFYNTWTDNPLQKVYVYEWQGSNKLLGDWPGAEMISTGQYVCVDGQYYPLWKYSYTSTKTPQKVKFSYTDSHGQSYQNDKDLTYHDGYFYRNDGKSRTGLNPVGYTGDDKYVYLYMHFKQDFLKNGKEGDVPRCHVFKDGTSTMYHTYGDDAEKMTLVNELYQIWAYPVEKTAIENNTYDNITFYFYKPDGSDQAYATNASISDEAYDAQHWTDFIYATEINGSVYRACQTYLTYDRFMELDGQDRPTAYIVGTEGSQIKVGDSWQTLKKWDIGAPVAVDKEYDCFYLNLKPAFNETFGGDKTSTRGTTFASSAKVSNFKVGWINPGAAKDWARSTFGDYSSSYDYKQRLWATYDLGIIGVDDTDSRISSVADLIIDGQFTVFQANKSVPYIYYNQYNWTLAQNNTGGSEYYVVIDPHSTCRSVTLCSFDPNPSVEVSVSSVGKCDNELSEEDALNITDEQLNGAADNDDISFTLVNKAAGTAKVIATDLSAIQTNGFDRQYQITVNGANAGTVHGENALGFSMDYMPFETSEDNNVTIRGYFKDTDTQLRFHSKIGKGTFTQPESVTLSKPAELTSVQGRLIYARTENDEDIYNLYVAGLDAQISSVYNVYADFSFVDSDNNPLVATLVKAGSDEESFIEKNINEKVGVTLPDGIDWSQYMMMDATNNPFPVLVKDAYKKSVATSSSTLPITFPCTIYAVYPFIYNPEAQPEVVKTQAPRRANESSDENFEGFQISASYVPRPVTVSVSNNITPAGVEGIIADNDNNNAPVEYYTISGIRVNGNLAPGIYIRRQGNSVSKVAIK